MSIDHVLTPVVVCPIVQASCRCNREPHDMTEPHTCDCGGSWVGAVSNRLTEIIAWPQQVPGVSDGG